MYLIIRSKAFSIVAFLLMAQLCYSQASDIGAVRSWKKTSTGISGKTEKAYFNIRAYNNNIIRVRVSLNEKMDDFSYALTEDVKPAEHLLTVSDQGRVILLQTEAIDVLLEKAPSFRVIFKNKSGRVINEDVSGKGFGTSFTGERSTIYKVLQPEERFVGLGEVLGDLDKRGSCFTLNNTDTYKYGDPRLSMYVSIPFYIGILQQDVYGIFYHNSYKTFFNFGVSTPGFSSITAEGGDADYFFIYDADIAGILNHYTYLTGRMPLPPRWSLGYHQSRCSYYPDRNVRLLAETFKQKELPIDCIVLDADYLQDYEPFRINRERFPDMKGLTAYLKKLNIEVTASVNPGIKVDDTYDAHHDGLSKDVFVKYADGSVYTAEIAPSLNNFVDFTKPDSRKWWIDQMKFLPENGIHGYWNDMNEPAVGASYLPDNLVFDFDGHKAGSLQAKNLYGMLMARSSYESAVTYGEGRRPFVLTRSGFAGVQRYAAVWTGDNTASDDFLTGGALLTAQMGLSGIPFVGDDLGGYIGPTSRELFIRWMETGTFAPFMRNHKEAYSQANEPWSYGEEAEAISREYLGFRYRLMPYLYSKFHEASLTGMPIARSLCIDFPHDDHIYSKPFQYQFLCGNAFLVVPVKSVEKSKSVYLPEGGWYDLHSDQYLQGGQTLTVETPMHQIPVFVKASSVVPMQSLVQSTEDKHNDTLYIHVFKGSTKNVFQLYEDDGKTLDYRHGKYCHRQITYDPANRELRLGKQDGEFQSTYSMVKCIFHGFSRGLSELTVDQKPVALSTETLRMIDGLHYLEEIYDKTYFKGLRLNESIGSQKTAVFSNSANEIRLTW